MRQSSPSCARRACADLSYSVDCRTNLRQLIPAWHSTLLDRIWLLRSCESFQFNRMSTCKGGVPRGPPKHQNKVVWKPNAGVKKNETEVGSKQRPFPAITGVCPRCKQQIEWRRKYGKYKALVEAGKCNDCGKRAVRQAHHTICTACSKNRNVCAKCCRPAETIVGSNVDAEEEERKQLEEALKKMRERDRRTLLRTLHGGGGAVKKSSIKDEDDEDTDADEEDDSEPEVRSDGDEDEDKDDEEEVGDADLKTH